jgi:hypothetical protein
MPRCSTKLVLIAVPALLAAFPSAALAQHDSLADLADLPSNTDQTLAPDDAAPQGPAGRVIGWVMASRDNGDLPFIVIDKTGAELFVFEASGRLVARAPVLVGIARGDDSMPGVGDRELSHIPVAQRTTPAGRFVANFGPAAGHKEQMLWVDLPDAISLHPVVTSNPKERRPQRLKSPTPSDNRITFGCINVAAELYSTTIEPLFRPAGGVVYILPETRPLSLVFAGLPADPQDSETFDAVFSGYRLRESEGSIAAAGD